MSRRVLVFGGGGRFWLCFYVISVYFRRVLRYQRGNQNPYIEEQTTQWPKEKVQKDKQRYTKHTYKTKDLETRTPLKTGGELRCSGRVSSSCSNSVVFFVFHFINTFSIFQIFYQCICLVNQLFKWSTETYKQNSVIIRSWPVSRSTYCN